ncbi:bacterioferritin-associated ferredoxin [Pantoea ananatis]
MYVCLCNAISDKTLREVVRRYQPKSIQQLRQIVPVGKQCGKCIRVAREIMDEEMQQVPQYRDRLSAFFPGT